jgi:phenylacetate-CoA ligase
VFITSLFKHAAPMIRYNMNDVSALADGACACGSVQRRITGIYGRSDSMVKLRGVNVFPEAIGALVGQNRRCNGEYVCILEGDRSGREDMTVLVEAADHSIDENALASELGQRFKEALGLKLQVEVVATGELDRLTGLSSTSKIRRLIDRRRPAPGSA